MGLPHVDVGLACALSHRLLRRHDLPVAVHHPLGTRSTGAQARKGIGGYKCPCCPPPGSPHSGQPSGSSCTCGWSSGTACPFSFPGPTEGHMSSHAVGLRPLQVLQCAVAGPGPGSCKPQRSLLVYCWATDDESVMSGAPRMPKSF